MERITIIGMSPVGVSIGLALKRAKLGNTEIVGSSGDRKALSAASKMGAMDKDIASLGAAVRDAQLVVLDLPFGRTREMLEAIAPVVEDGCVVTDMSTTKVRVLEWADELLPGSVSFVGGHPLLKTNPREIEDSTASLFEGTDYCIMPSPSADHDSVKTVVGLVELLGAKPLFLDAHEHDSYSAAMDVLPMVLSSALVTTTSGSEAWREMHKMAAAEYADFSRLASNDPLDNEASCIANRDALVHWLDEYIKELYSYRNQIKENDDQLVDIFIKAWEARAKWEVGAVVPTNDSHLPSAGMSMANAFFGERLAQRYKQMTGDDKNKESWKYKQNG